MPDETRQPLPSGFYNSKYSTKYDRVYSAGTMSKLFDGLILDGVYLSSKENDPINKQFLITALATPAMKVKSAPGRAWFKGTYTVLTEETEYTIPTANSSNPRIDAIVIEVNFSTRENTIKVITGTPAAHPTKPEKEYDDENGIYQYPLAYITVRANTTTIEDFDIAYAVGLETPYFAWLGEDLSIAELYSKWKLSLARTTMPFTTWFACMQDILDPDEEPYDMMLDKIDDIWSNPFVMGVLPKVDETVATSTGDGITTTFDLSSFSINVLADILIDGKLAYGYTYDDGVVEFEEAPANGSAISFYYVPVQNLDTYTLYFEEVQNA